MDEGAVLEERGNYEHALAAYVRKRQWEAAARVAASLDRNFEAAGYCLAANQPYEAAVCYQKAGKLKECLEALVKVAPTSPRYRPACVHAVRVAQMVGTPLSNLISFMAPFLNTRPASTAEATALVQLADAVAGTEKYRLAHHIYRAVLLAFPDHAEAREGLAAVAEKDAAARATPAKGISLATGPLPSAPKPPLAAASLATPLPSAPPAGARRPRLADHLVAKGKLPGERLANLLKRHPEARANENALRDALVANELVSEQDVVHALAELTGIPYIDERELTEKASPDAAKALSAEQAEMWLVAPISLIERHLTVAMRDPRDITRIDQLRFASGAKKVTGVFATEGAIRKALGKLYHGEEPPGPDDWRGQVYDPSSNALTSSPFSDRVTGTRERQFDTQDLERRVMLEPEAEPPPLPEYDRNAPGRVQTIQITTLPEIGSTFAGRYLVEALIGEGGSAVVFRVVDTEISEPVALKIFRPTSQKEAEQQINRFKLELSLSRLLAHPNIIRLYDLGVHGQLRYLTMELLEGEDLGARMAKLGKPLPIVEGLRYLEQICVALQAAHDRGVIHRDVKPQNLFVTRDGIAKLMDFGIAKRQQSRGVTLNGVVAGTPEYISPEQISGFSSVTHKTDLYALGGTAYMLFTGAPPFAHPELMGLLLAQANEKPASPRLKNPEIPPELDAVILKLLEKNPDQRFESAAELGGTLSQIRRKLETGAAGDSVF